MMAGRFGANLVDHRTWVIAGDGCLQEGISHEAIDLAGHLKLGKLTVFWDDNAISIDGGTDLSTSTNQLARFRAAGWHVQDIDGHDHAAISDAITAAMASRKPSLIACKTTIGLAPPILPVPPRPMVHRLVMRKSRRPARRWAGITRRLKSLLM